MRKWLTAFFCCLLCLCGTIARAADAAPPPVAPAPVAAPAPDAAVPAPAPSAPATPAPGAAAAPDAPVQVDTTNPNSVNLYGTIIFGRASGKLDKWERVKDYIQKRLAELNSRKKELGRFPLWQKLQKEVAALKAKGVRDVAILDFVSNFWNQHCRYVIDSTIWPVKDYWETPKEFLEKNGDCEDFAIMKYFTLKTFFLEELGIKPHQMRLVLGRNEDGEEHVVLAVFMKNSAWILDIKDIENVLNGKKATMGALEHTQHIFKPQISLNEAGYWAHSDSPE